MKAVTLPINVIVVMVIVVLVLMSIIGFFLLAWGPGSEGLALEAKKQAGCFKWKCDTTGLGTDFAIDGMTLQEICDKLGPTDISGKEKCKKVCNCPGT